jgi:tripartite-type tricarboxylate transporter receptor subunit TctC
MIKGRKKWLLVFLSLVLSQFFALVVVAKEGAYPEKEIRFLCGYSPGSVSDLNARMIAKIASKYLQKPLVVVNMAGAAGTPAVNELIKSAADGYTILTLTTGYFAYTRHSQKIPFDSNWIKPLMGYWEYSHVLFTRGESGYTRIQDLIAYGKKNPGAIKYGIPARGIGPHFMGALMFKNTDVKAVDLPFKGSSENAQAVIGGHAIVGIDDFAPVKHHVKAGTLKALVAFLDQRHKDLPDVPTTKELGYGDLAILNPLGIICVHKNTPSDRAQKIHDLMKKVTEDPEFKQMCDEMGQRCKYISPQTVTEAISRSEKLTVPMLKELNLFVQ